MQKVFLMEVIVVDTEKYSRQMSGKFLNASHRTMDNYLGNPYFTVSTLYEHQRTVSSILAKEDK